MNDQTNPIPAVLQVVPITRTHYVFPARVVDVVEHKPILSSRKDPTSATNIITTYGPPQYHALIEWGGAVERVCFGDEKPDLHKGQTVEIVVRPA